MLPRRQGSGPTEWITRLPFPVHVVDRVETYDRISRNRFVTRYSYHHGRFNGVEREFCGFGLVEQYDTEEFAAFDRETLDAENEAAASNVPPMLIKTWFHTGARLADRGASSTSRASTTGNRERRMRSHAPCCSTTPRYRPA